MGKEGVIVLIKKMRASLKRKEYDLMLQKAFLELSILETQFHSGEAKSYDLWLWDDNLKRVEEYMINDVYAALLHQRYSQMRNVVVKHFQTN